MKNPLCRLLVIALLIGSCIDPSPEKWIGACLGCMVAILLAILSEMENRP